MCYWDDPSYIKEALVDKDSPVTLSLLIQDDGHLGLLLTHYGKRKLFVVANSQGRRIFRVVSHVFKTKVSHSVVMKFSNGKHKQLVEGWASMKQHGGKRQKLGTVTILNILEQWFKTRVSLKDSRSNFSYNTGKVTCERLQNISRI